MLVLEAYDLKRRPDRKLLKAMCGPEENEDELYRQLPMIGSPHPHNPSLLCAKIDAVRVSPVMFDVEVHYEQRSAD